MITNSKFKVTLNHPETGKIIEEYVNAIDYAEVEMMYDYVKLLKIELVENETK